MCKAFSAIVKKNGDVLWKFGMDSHSDILKHFNIPDNEDEKERLEFARIEISPANNNYLKPDKWQFKLDESITPAWWTKSYQVFSETEHKKWLKQFHKIIINKEIVIPFNIVPPKKVLKKHIALLKEWGSVLDSVGVSVWDSVRDSVGDSVGESVWDSVRDSVRDSVWDSVWASVRDSVGDSVWDRVWAIVWASAWASAWAYAGSFFNLPRDSWEYTEKIDTKKYPFQPLVNLWEMGIVPSFDDTTWRLHAGKDAKIIFEISQKDLKGKELK